MKNSKGNTIAKRLIAIILVLATMLLQFPTNLLAAPGDKTEEKVTLTAKWNSNREVEVGNTDNSFGLTYTISFNGVQEGFKDVRLIADTDSNGQYYDRITFQNVTSSSGSTIEAEGNGISHAEIYFGNVNQGVSYSGQVSVIFKNEDRLLNRKITLKVVGKYKDPKSGEMRDIEKVVSEYESAPISKELTATVTPATVITSYNANLTWKYVKDWLGYQRQVSPSYSLDKVDLKGEATYGTDNTVCGWYATRLYAVYPIHISSAEKTQKLNLNIKINRRLDENTSRMSHGYTIDWNGLDTDLGAPTSVDNADGSVTYTFTKGEDSDTYNSANTFAIDKDYTIVVTYTTDNTNPKTSSNADYKTYLDFDAELNTIGFKIDNSYDETSEQMVETAEKITITKQLSNEQNTNLCSYTPAMNAWKKVQPSSSYIGNSSYLTTKIDNLVRTNFLNDGKTNVKLNVNISDIDGQRINQTGKINFAAPKLTYKVDNGIVTTITLTPEQIKLTSISTIQNGSFVNGSEEHSLATNGYQPTTNVNDFSIKLENFLNYPTSNPRDQQQFALNYELNLEALGLSQTEIQSIERISVGFTTSDSNLLDGNDTFYIYRKVEKTINEYSYMELSLGENFDTTTSKANRPENKKVTLKMYKNTNVIRGDTETIQNYIVNQNPVFFVLLPGSSTGKIDYEFGDDVVRSTNANVIIDEENLDIVRVNGEDYLVIPCTGTYDSRNSAEIDIEVNYTRILRNAAPAVYETTAFMLTDNENYYSDLYNNGFEKNGIVPERIFRARSSFNVNGASVITATTEIAREGDKTKYKPNPSDGINNDTTEQEKPLVIGSNKKVTYDAKITSSGNTLKDITIIARLPRNNNTFINDNENQLIASDFQLPATFYTEYGEYIKGNVQGTAVAQKDLANANILGVVKEKSDGTEDYLGVTQYQIYYTTEANATFDSTTFVEYTTGADLSTAKNIKVVITDTNEKLQSGESYILRYEMTMPDEACMVGAQTAVRYTKTTETEPEALYSPAAYVINGEGNKIKVKKEFENLATGASITSTFSTNFGVSTRENIEFKLQYYNETTGRKEFLKDSSDNDITATTDANGIATFTNVPEGRYYVIETTEFTKYSGIGSINVVKAQSVGTSEITVTNKLKRGRVIVNKKWQGSTASQGECLFKLQRYNYSGETYTIEDITATTDENGIAIFEDVPYGRYKLTEVNTASGWKANTSSYVTVNVNNAEVSTNFTNQPIQGTIKIVKTVPEGEDVTGLSFRITGSGKFKNPEALTFNPITDMTVTVGGTNPSNVSISKSANNTQATITISKLYLGNYNIEEVDIPTFEVNGTSVTKYAPVSAQVELTSNQTLTVNFDNVYKQGTVVINKTARMKKGDEYIEIGDLSGFKVHVRGTSLYGHQIDKVIELDEDGYGRAKVEIGTYTIEEEAREGFTAYYGEGVNLTTEPPQVTVSYNGTTTQKIYNEHSGVGYVKVVKKLEGVTDPNKILDYGITFRVYGKDVAGQTVNEEIKIDTIDEENQLAYGISNAISAGGTYELQETNIPDHYEPAAPVEVQVETNKTCTKVLDNVRSRGNLEATTTTSPAGGPLTDIKYKVTPVEINRDGTYVTTGEPTELNGSNTGLNPSFAEMRDIYSGYYLVELVQIPDGWKAEVTKEIVDVPTDNTGYAEFEITKEKTLGNNKLIINKQILNSNSEQATAEEIAKAELSEDESFEVKITNVNTKEEYYAFPSSDKPAVIQGLDVGTYAVEEIYKPKYLTEGYYEKVEVPSETPGEPAEIVNAPIVKVEGKYVFKITESNGTVNDKELTVKNKINTAFGFGGQEHIDNLSTIVVEDETIAMITRAVIYVEDEENNAISGVKFRLRNSEGVIVDLANLGQEFEIAQRKLTIRRLPVGKYTLECTQVPEGYERPENKEIIVYADAVQVARVEVRKIVPRGSIRLSTTYTTDDGETKPLPRSKYKVVNKATGELVKFVRTPTGDYRKTNQEDGSTIVALKGGPVDLLGLETGDYQVGIVDVTRGFGIINKVPEEVTVVENGEEVVNTEVQTQEIIQVDGGYGTFAYLTKSGDLYVKGYNGNKLLGDGGKIDHTSRFRKVEFPYPNVKIVKFVMDFDNIHAIDSESRIWTWGNEYNGNMGGTSSSSSGSSSVPKIITQGALEVESSYTGMMYLARGDGYVFTQGLYKGDGSTSTSYGFGAPLNIPTGPGTPKTYYFKAIGKDLSGNYGGNHTAIDINGKLWIWGGYSQSSGCGRDVYSSVCLSDEISVLADIKFVKSFDFSQCHFAIDENGDLWAWGNSSSVVQYLTSENPIYPSKINLSLFGNAKIKDLTAYKGCTIFIATDEYGRLWSFGTGTSNAFGYTPVINPNVPYCISNDVTNPLYGITIKDVEFGGDYNVIAVDTNNNLWTWGQKSYYYDMPLDTPIPVNTAYKYEEHLDYNLKFNKIFVSRSWSSTNAGKYAIDNDGRVWVWGYNNNGALGYDTYNSFAIPETIEIPGNPKMKKISASNYGDATIMLSEDGRVYVCGHYSILGNGTDNLSSNRAITEITNNFNLDPDVKIEDVLVEEHGSFVAIDSKGRLYTCGSKLAGRSTNKYNIECLSKVPGSLLADAEIVSVDCNDSTDSICFALAKDGRVFQIGADSYSIYYNGTVKIKELVHTQANVAGLDDEGKIWFFGTSGMVCISDNPNTELYIKHKDPDYKIVKVYYAYDKVLAKDSNGDFWRIDITGSGSSMVSKLNLKLKNFVDIQGDIILDGYGQLWTVDYSTGEVVCFSSTYKNPVYNVKVVQSRGLTSVVDENGIIYRIQLSGVITNTENKTFEQQLKEKGVTIISEPSTKNSDYQVYEQYVLDSNGYIWSGTERFGTTPGTDLADAYTQNGFKITELFNIQSEQTWFALDNNGNLWSWGYNANRECGYENAGTSLTPKLVTTETNNLKNVTSIEYVGGSVVVARDDEGNAWIWGDDHNAYNVNASRLEGRKIKDMVVENDEGILLCEDGTVYIADKNIRTNSSVFAWQNIGTYAAAEKVFKIGNTYIISGNNKTWTLGQNYIDGFYGLCGTSDMNTTEYFTTPQLITVEGEKEFTVAEFISRKTVRVIDTEGRTWMWGNTRSNGVNSITTTINVASRVVSSIIKSDGDEIVFFANGNARYNNTNVTTSTAIKKIYGSTITEENIKEFVDKFKENSSIIVVNGKACQLTLDSNGLPTDAKIINDITYSEMHNKNIVYAYLESGNGHAIDEDGKLYVWGTQYTGLGDDCTTPVCLTDRISYYEDIIQLNNTPINVTIENAVKGVKFSNIINDKFAIAENGDVWYFTLSGEPTNLSKEYKGVENPMYGTTVVDLISGGYVMSDNKIWNTSNAYPMYVGNAPTTEVKDWAYAYSGTYVALDVNGKIWVCGNNDYILGLGDTTTTDKEAICLSNIEGTALYQAYQNDANFKIEKVEATSSLVKATDSNGKLWIWGNTSSLFGSTLSRINTPTNIETLTDTALGQAYHNDSNFQLGEQNIGMTGSPVIYYYDTNGDIWYENGNRLDLMKNIVTGDLRTDIDLNSTSFKFKFAEEVFYLIGNNGCVYVGPNPWVSGSHKGSPTSYTKLNTSQLNDIEEITKLKDYGSNDSYESTYKISLARTRSGQYKIINLRSYYNSSNTATYSINVTNFTTCAVKQCIQAGYYGAVLDTDGKLWVPIVNIDATPRTYTMTCLSDSPSYVIHDKVIQSVFKPSNASVYDSDIYLECIDGIIYKMSLYDNSMTEVTDKYDELIKFTYGVDEVTTEQRKEAIISGLDSKSPVKKDGKVYIVTTDSEDKYIYKEVKNPDQYIGGIGTITEVVGENEIKTSSGKIYQLVPSGTDSFTINETDTPTEFTTGRLAEPTVTIDGTTVVEQTPHKALDIRGNLFVWDTYTGLTKETEGIVNLTEEELSVEPIYSHTNGWTVVVTSH